MKKKIALIGLMAILLTSCGPDEQGKQDASVDALPANAPAVGTSIKSVTKAVKPAAQEASAASDQVSANANANASDDEFKEIAWEDLEIPGKGMDSILEKYQEQIDSIPEDDPRDQELMQKMQAELNAAPINPAMDGKKIKLPGFVTPLEVDQKKGVVKEFLLVPYFGACIHVPPPPVNQTLLIKPIAGHSITLDESYDPVWVTGTLQADGKVTDLAEAGYQITDAQVTKYTEEDEAAAEAGGESQ